MVETAYLMVVVLLAGFAVMEGWNFGIGAVSLLVAHSRSERRAVTEAIGSLWSWHEVWLIAAGGTLLLAFPKALAAALSGYYLAVFLLLWCLVLRGVALEFGGHLADELWQQFWDVVFALASALLAVLFGAALGNVVRGVPLGADGRMFMPLFTDFMPRGRTGILDWYTIAVAVFTLVLLSAHGALHLAVRAGGAVQERAIRLARRLWPAAGLLLIVVTVLTSLVRPDYFGTMGRRAAGWLAAAVIAAALGAVALGLRSGKYRLAFLGSCGLIVGLLGGAAASLYPVLLLSTLDPAWSLSAHAAATGGYALSRALLWWVPALALSITWAVLILRKLKLR